MKQLLIEGIPCLLGKFTLTDKQFFSLSPGDQVNIFGDGRKTGCYTTLTFNPALTYRGAIRIEEEEYFAFETPSGGVTGFNLFNPVEKVYICFEEICGMVGLMSFTDLKLSVMTPDFKLRKP